MMHNRCSAELHSSSPNSNFFHIDEVESPRTRNNTDTDGCNMRTQNDNDFSYFERVVAGNNKRLLTASNPTDLHLTGKPGCAVVKTAGITFAVRL